MRGEGCVSVTPSVSQSKHCLLEGTVQCLQSLKAVAPPISVLITARSAESIMSSAPPPAPAPCHTHLQSPFSHCRMFSPDKIAAEQAEEIFDEVDFTGGTAHGPSVSLVCGGGREGREGGRREGGREGGRGGREGGREGGRWSEDGGVRVDGGGGEGGDTIDVLS